MINKKLKQNDTPRWFFDNENHDVQFTANFTFMERKYSDVLYTKKEFFEFFYPYFNIN